MRVLFVAILMFLFCWKGLGQDTIYYDAYWSEVPYSDSIEFYRVITDEKDNLILCKDYFVNGNIQMIGTYSKANPEIKEGEFIYFNSIGDTTRIVCYSDNRIVSEKYNTSSKQPRYTKNEIKGGYVFAFGRYIEWPNQDTLLPFRIGILAEDSIYRLFRQIFSGRTINNRPVFAIHITENNLYRDSMNVLFINDNYCSSLKEIHNTFENDSVLLISSNCEDKDLIMINFTDLDTTKKFEVNIKNILLKNLTIDKKILSLGGQDISNWRELALKFDTTLVEKEIVIDGQQHTIEEKDDEISTKNKVITLILSLIFIITILLLINYRNYKLKKKANIKLAQQNDEIAAQRDEIETQRDTVTEQRDHIAEIHEEITDSISYAKRIQAAVLPSDKNASEILGEHFIVFRPHSVVSGDFYWATKTDEWTIVTAADCTGHGVPGAFMSMLGVSFLNEIVRKKDVTNTAEILNHLRASVIEALKQTGEQGTQKDGMDMSIIAIHNLPAGRQETKKALWAGANNPIWIIRAENISEDFEEPADAVEFIKGDSMPVAVHEIMDDFTNHEINLNKGDLIYLFSDGYPDQFGGKKGKKFMYKPFKRLLVENSNKPMTEQKEALETTLDDWMNFEGTKYEQIDDITVVGLRV